MKKTYLNLSVLAVCAMAGCAKIPDDLNPYRMRRLSGKQIIANLKKHENELESINKLYEKKYWLPLYAHIRSLFNERWESPEVLIEYYEFRLNHSRKRGNPIVYAARKLFPLYVRVDNKKAVASLPKFRDPFFKEARKRFLNDSKEDFLKWMEAEITDETLPGPPCYKARPYCELLEAAAVLNRRYDIAKDANIWLLARAPVGADFGYTVAKIANYADKTKNVDPTSNDIIVSYFNEMLRDRSGKKVILTSNNRHYRIIRDVINKYDLLKEQSEKDATRRVKKLIRGKK